jgi:hypothetical protein
MLTRGINQATIGVNLSGKPEVTGEWPTIASFMVAQKCPASKRSSGWRDLILFFDGKELPPLFFSYYEMLE